MATLAAPCQEDYSDERFVASSGSDPGWHVARGQARGGSRSRPAAERERDDERRAAANLALDRHRSAVGFDDRLDETQAKTKAPLRPAAIAAEEAIPDARQLVCRDAGPGVADLQRGHSRVGRPIGPHRDDDPAAGRRVLDGVVDEVGGNLLETGPVAGDEDALRRRLEAERDV